MSWLGQDLRFGFRVLVKSPGLAAIAIIALGLGIGLTTMMFSIVHGAIFTGLPFERSDRLMHLEMNNLSKGEESLEVPIHDYLDWKASQKSFESLAAFSTGTVNLSGTEKPERFDGAFVSANLFETLRVKPLLGRGFHSGEDAPGAERVATLGFRVWRDRYLSDPDIVGKTIRANGKPTTIVGVMPDGFLFPFQQQVWIPLDQDPVKLKRGEGDTLEVFGRLNDGVTPDEAYLEMSSITKRLALEHPETNKGLDAVLKPYTEEYVGGRIANLLYTMLAAVALVLLIACANVTNLLLARTALRAKEIAIRTAIGASRRRVVGQLLIESLVLALAGAVLGVFLAWLGIRAFNVAIADMDKPFWIDIGLHTPVLLFTLGITCLTAFVAGIVPAIQASRADVNTLLKDESRGSSSFRLGLLSKSLVVAEVAFSCGLLISAGLMIRTIVNMQTMDLGFDPNNLFTARIALFESKFPEKKQQVEFFDQVVAKLQGQPGIRATALATSMPLVGSWTVNYQLDGQDYSNDDFPEARYAHISNDYFSLFDAKLLEGRLFDTRDTIDGQQVALVNQSFATQVWPGESPLGKRVRMGGKNTEQPWRTVVGVVQDLQMNDFDEPEETAGFYVPLQQDIQRFVSLMVRTDGPPMALTSLVRDTVASVDADTPIYFVRSMEDILAREQFFFRLFGSLFVIFGAVALVLASVGIYGVMAFSVSRRTQEIGVRMALGAQKRDVLGMILGQGAIQMGIGLVLGLGLGWGLSKLLSAVELLVGVSIYDPMTYAGILLLLGSVGFLACFFPARRASKVDPMVALRYE